MAIHQDILEQVFAHLTTGQLLRSAALVCKDWRAAAYQSSSIRITVCGDSKMASATEPFWCDGSFDSVQYAVDSQLARFKRWLATPNGKHTVNKLDLTYTYPDVFWGVSRWLSQPRPHWLLLELSPRGLSQLQSLKLTNTLLRKYNWMDVADGCKQLTRLELEQPGDCPGRIEGLKPLSALVHLRLKHFDGGLEDWKSTLDSIGQLTHLSLESCSYHRSYSGIGDSLDEGGDRVKEHVTAGLSQLRQLHLDLEQTRRSLSDFLSFLVSTCHSTEFPYQQDETDYEYYSNLLKSRPPQQLGVHVSKHSQRWISTRAAKQWSNQSRQGGKAKCQQLRCFKQKL